MTNDTLTRARATLARLAEAERAATPGPWRTEGHPTGPPIVAGAWDVIVYDEGAPGEEDAAAIVALRNAAPALLALAEASADAMQWLAIVEAEKRDGVIAGVVLDNAQREGAAACDRMRAALAALADEPGEADALARSAAADLRAGRVVSGPLKDFLAELDGDAALADEPGEVAP